MLQDIEQNLKKLGNMKYLSLIVVTLILTSSLGQTFTNTTPVTVSGNSNTCMDIPVTGISDLSEDFGLEEICVQVDLSNHLTDWLEIYLEAPSGEQILLSYENEDIGDDNTICFRMDADSSIRRAEEPHQSSYIPEQDFSHLNSEYVTGSGTWRICVYLDWSTSFNISQASLVFSNTPPTNCDSEAADLCIDAPTICSLDGYCGSTLPIYNSESIGGYCGFTIENNSFVKFVPRDSSVSVDVEVKDCEHTEINITAGVQFSVLKTDNCTSFQLVQCAPDNPLAPGQHSFAFTGLNPHEEYYLHIDGYAGDVCSYKFKGGTGLNLLSIETNADSICPGQQALFYSEFDSDDTLTGVDSIFVDSIQNGTIIRLIESQQCTGVHPEYTFSATCSGPGAVPLSGPIPDLELESTPNIFTPDGDGENDLFFVSLNVPVAEYRLTVFDRWGLNIYTTENQDFTWDGKTEKGNIVTDGVYFYTLDIVTFSGEKYNLRNNLHVLSTK